MSKVKVIEIVGQKLDPKAKYLFLINKAAMPSSDIGVMARELDRIIGSNFTIALTDMPVEETMKVFEVMPKESK